MYNVCYDDKHLSVHHLDKTESLAKFGKYILQLVAQSLGLIFAAIQGDATVHTGRISRMYPLATGLSWTLVTRYFCTAEY